MDESRLSFDEFRGTVIVKLDNIIEAQKELKEGLWGQGGVRDKVGITEKDIVLLSGDIQNINENIKELKAGRPGLLLVVTLFGFLGGLIGRYIPWRSVFK